MCRANFLVKFKGNVSETKKSNIHNKNGGQKLKEFKKLRLERVKLKDKVKVKDALNRYKMALMSSTPSRTTR